MAGMILGGSCSRQQLSQRPMVALLLRGSGDQQSRGQDVAPARAAAGRRFCQGKDGSVDCQDMMKAAEHGQLHPNVCWPFPASECESISFASSLYVACGFSAECGITILDSVISA
jgi:hypothetical protein